MKKAYHPKKAPGASPTSISNRLHTISSRFSRIAARRTSMTQSLPQDQVTISELVPAISIRDGFPVRLHDARQPDQRREHREVARQRIVESRQQAVDRADRIPRVDEEAREALPWAHAVRSPCGLERADDRRPDRDDSVTSFAGMVDQIGGGW